VRTAARTAAHTGVGAISSVVSLCVLGCGGGGALASPVAASDTVLRPAPELTYAFTRQLLRTRRDERNVSELAGELRVVAPGQHQLTITRARQLQADDGIRAIDPGSGGVTGSVGQRVGVAGTRAEPLDSDAVFALGTELSQALTLLPIGGTGLVLPIENDGAAMIQVGWSRESGLPQEFQVRCTRAEVPDVPTQQRVRCEGPLDRALEVSEEARAQGVSADLRGTIALDATLDRDTGMGRHVELHIVMDVIERMGPYEEHEAAEVVLRSELSAGSASGMAASGTAASGTGASEPPRDACGPQRAAATGDCDALLDFYVWDGSECLHAGSGCGCAGADCRQVYSSVEACREAHAACPAR